LPAATGAFRTPWQLGMSSALTASLLSVIGATAPHLRTHLGIGTAALTVAFVGQTLGALTGSWLLGRLRHPLVELSPMALLAAAAVAVAMLAPALPVLVGAMCVAGAAGFAVNVRAQAETMRRAGAGRTGALSQYHVWGGFGAMAFPLVVAALLSAGVPWHAAFALLICGYLAYAVVNRGLRVVPARGAIGAARPRVGVRGRWATAIAVLGGGIQVTLPLYLGVLLVDRFGATAAGGTAAIGLYALALFAARALGSRALARLSAERQLQLSCGLLLVGYGLLAAAESTVAVLFAVAALGAGSGQLFPLGMARAAREVGDDRYVTALVFSLYAGAQIVIPGGVAVLLHAVELRTALVLTLPVVVVIALAVRLSRR
jgi:FSR family fosmidomycin resistance protein-like MFS transporter